MATLVAIGLIILALSYSGLIDFRSAVSSWIFELLTAISVQLLTFYNSRSSTKSEVRAALAEHYNRLNVNVFTPLPTATFLQRTPEWWGISQLYQILFVWDVSQIEQSDFWDGSRRYCPRVST
jgi:hypothetical protein